MEDTIESNHIAINWIGEANAGSSGAKFAADGRGIMGRIVGPSLRRSILLGPGDHPGPLPKGEGWGDRDAQASSFGLKTTTTRTFSFLVALLTILSAASHALAAEEESATELAKKTQNPVADLISVPSESDINFNNGTRNATTYVLNVQPIIPFHLNKDWNLITRTILPIINEPSLFSGRRSAFGLGDINPSFFFSPAKAGAFMWGISPTFTLPTATDPNLGSHRFSMGPAFAALTIQGPLLPGVLVNNQWSTAGWGDHPVVNQMLLEPFVNYNFGSGWHLSTELIMTADWQFATGIRKTSTGSETTTTTQVTST